MPAPRPDATFYTFPDLVAYEPLRPMPDRARSQAEFERRELPQAPQMGVLDSLRRHLPIALLPVVVLACLAVALAFVRTPVYTSEARLNVGGLNLTQQSIEGYTAAVQQLAVAYSRSVDASGVIEPVAREVGLSPTEVVDQVSATPIPGSSVVSVEATGSDAKEAEAVADATADSLVDYAIELNSGRSTSERLLERYRGASKELQEAQGKLQSTPGSGTGRQALETRVAVARLQRDTTGFLFTQSQAGQAATELIQKLAPAREAASDRRKVLQNYLAAAVIAGLLIGVGLAVGRANALARRRLGES